MSNASNIFYMLRPVKHMHGVLIAYDMLNISDGKLVSVDRYAADEFINGSDGLYCKRGSLDCKPVKVITDRPDEVKRILRSVDNTEWLYHNTDTLKDQAYLMSNILKEVILDLSRHGIKLYYLAINPHLGDDQYAYNVDVIFGFPFAWTEVGHQNYQHSYTGNVTLSFFHRHNSTVFLDVFASIKTITTWSSLECNESFYDSRSSVYVVYCKELVKKLMDRYYKLK